MSIEICTNCPCRFAVGLACCPQCGALAPGFAARQRRAEESMARITVAGGPSNAQAQPGEPGYVPPAEEAADVPVTAADNPPADAQDEPVSSVNDQPEGVNDPAGEHADKPVADLKAELRDRGLPVSGSKADLVQRLVQHDQVQADAEATAGD